MAIRKQINFIYGTVACCCLSIIICGISLGTTNWYTGLAITETDSTVNTEINYGLFKGSKTKKTPGLVTKFDLTVVCADGVCMYSCGVDADTRRQDIDDLLKGVGNGDNICVASGTREKHQIQNRAVGDDDVRKKFLSFGFWLVTIVFVGIGIGFSALGGSLAIYNTFRTPIQPILSIFGLYVWNGIAAISVLLAMILWGSAHATTLRNKAAVSDTISQIKNSEGAGNLGFSYWILLLATLSNLASIGLIRYRSWKIAKMEEKITQVIDEKMTNGDILLF